MISFKNYLLYRGAVEKIPAIARRLVENQDTAALDQAKTTLMNTFQQEFQKNPQAALTWLNQLYTKGLPADYKNYYGQWQQQQKAAPANQNQNQDQSQANNNQGNNNQGQVANQANQGANQGANTGAQK
jgi:hypothetical protein